MTAKSWIKIYLSSPEFVALLAPLQADSQSRRLSISALLPSRSAPHRGWYLEAQTRPLPLSTVYFTLAASPDNSRDLRLRRLFPRILFSSTSATDKFFSMASFSYISASSFRSIKLLNLFLRRADLVSIVARTSASLSLT